jgi:hypothetical protein
VIEEEIFSPLFVVKQKKKIKCFSHLLYLSLRGFCVRVEDKLEAGGSLVKVQSVLARLKAHLQSRYQPFQFRYEMCHENFFKIKFLAHINLKL